MEAVTISAPRRYSEGGRHVAAAQIGVEGRRFDIFYRTSRGPLAAGVESFLTLALYPAMRLGAPIHLDAPLSPFVMARIDRLQELLTTWFSDFKRTTIEPVNAAPPTETLWPGGRGVACFFSGGVDSFHAVLTHQAELTHLIFAHGFDIALDKQAFRQTVSSAIEAAAAELGKPLVAIETNVRTLLDRYVDWTAFGFTAALSSMALALSPQFHTVYMAGGASYTQIVPSGGHPLVTDLLSTREVEIVQTGRSVNRYQKVAHLARSEIAMRYLRVCWENRSGAYNCGQCSKCLHTMIDLRLEGALERCRTFDRPLDLAAVRQVTFHSGSERRYFAEALAQAEKRGDDPELLQALRDSVGDMMAHTPEIELRTRLFTAEAYVTYLQVSLRKAEKRTERLSSQLQTVLASRSWRMTAPLRRAAQGMRRRAKNRRT